MALTLKKPKQRILQNNITKKLMITKNSFTTVHKEVDGPNAKKQAAGNDDCFYKKTTDLH